jgi:predicted glycoside hydrolase/deacetylase ChbG (UPF0249 family)
MPKNLIINADDFGMNQEINEGTKYAIEQGIISSVSLMPNMPYFDDAVRFLKKHPKISIGLHFNITEGKPLISPNMAGNLIREDDCFYHWPQLIGRLVFNNIKKKEIDEELQAQFAKLKATGLRITHIDSHHHVHLYPAIFEIISKFAENQNIYYVRGSYFNIWNLTLGIWKKPIPTQLIVNLALLLNNFKNKKYSKSYEVNRFYDINWGKNLKNTEFISILNKLPEGTTEFICHLAVESKTGNKKFLTPRYKIFKLLSNQTIRKHVIHNGITLTSRDNPINNRKNALKSN